MRCNKWGHKLGIGFVCTLEKDHQGEHKAYGLGHNNANILYASWPNLDEPVQVVLRSRLDRLKSLTTGGEISIETVARVLDCPEASIRRDLQTLRKEGYYIVLDQKQIKNYGLRQALIAAADDVDGDDREEHF